MTRGNPNNKSTPPRSKHAWSWAPLSRESLFLQQLRAFLLSLASVFRDPSANLSPAQRAYLEQRQLDEVTRVIKLYNWGGLTTFVAATIALLALGHPQLKIQTVTWTVLHGLECLIWAVAEPFVSDKNRPLIARIRGVIIVLISMICSSWLFDAVFRLPELSPDYFVMCGITLGVASWGIGAGAVYYGRSVLLFLAVLPFVTLLPAVGAKATNQLGLFLVAFIPNVVAAFYFLIERRGHHNRSLTEFAASELAIQNEKLKRLAIEGEVLLASKVQESIQAPTGMKFVGSHVIEFFHVPYGLLGGDWLAERELPDGRQVIVVADVTGKGIPAAMVVQAVQSLWVASLADPDFDPLRWMQVVNKTLFLLSRKESHTMSMGILVFDDSRMVYYSAGHVPMFMLQDIRDEESTKAIHSHGSLLGVSRDAYIEPVTVALPADQNYFIIVGTDGILDWQTRRSRQAVYELAHAAIQDGMNAVAKHPVGDDKILVTVKRRELRAHLRVA